MKPIFEKEKVFLEKHLGITLPNYCWRKASKIYLNHTDEKPFLTFKVDLLNNKINIKKYEQDKIRNSKTWEEEFEEVKDELERKVQESIDKTKEYIMEQQIENMFVTISGGKDSDVMKEIVDIAFKEINDEGYNIDYKLIAFNTSNESAQTYKHLKQIHNMNKDNIISPTVGYYEWVIKKKNYFTPSKLVRNCCSTYKEGQLSKVMDKKETTLTFLGIRSQESSKRNFYDWDLNKSYKEKLGAKSNVPENWKRFLPIVKWSDAEVWLYILNRKLPMNEMYEIGFSRVGCLICCFQTDYTDLLIREHFPKQTKRWCDILNKNYEIYGVEKRLKWSLDEWVYGGKWKTSTSKELDIIDKKPTDKRVEELANLKGISKELARKYFKRNCSCGKKLNPTEVAMFLKLTGRYENVEDNRQYLCKKCLCDSLGILANEYKEKSIEFTQSNCELF